jgi:hypothetical protein
MVVGSGKTRSEQVRAGWGPNAGTLRETHARAGGPPRLVSTSPRVGWGLGRAGRDDPRPGHPPARSSTREPLFRVGTSPDVRVTRVGQGPDRSGSGRDENWPGHQPSGRGARREMAWIPPSPSSENAQFARSLPSQEMVSSAICEGLDLDGRERPAVICAIASVRVFAEVRVGHGEHPLSDPRV